MSIENTTAVEALDVNPGIVANEVTTAANFRESALALAARGIPVIPVRPRQKLPALKEWQNLASTDTNQIEKWHNENPQYNVGAVAKLNGFWFLDCDVLDLPEQIEESTGQPIPKTLSVRSGKGIHFYFKHSKASQSLKKNIPLKDANGDLLADIKLNNGYVVGPGSIHPSGKRYEFVDESVIVEAPDWLVTWIKGQNDHAEAEGKDHTTAGKVPEGMRDNFLFNQACKLRKTGMAQSDALDALLTINKNKCAPPMQDFEVQQKIESAYSYPPSKQPMCEDLILDPNSPALTDLGNAKRLVLAEGKDLHYCYGNNKWFVWDDKKWGADDTGEIQRRAKRTVRNMLSEAATLDDDKSRISLIAHEQDSESQGRLSAMIGLARSEEGVAIRLTDFDRDPMLFNCLNGTLDLRTGGLLEHRRENLINKIAPVEHDPNAKCPTWLQFLKTVTGGKVELADYLQRCVGYSLTGQTVEHALFLLYGIGANGKGTFCETLRYVLGEYSQAADFGTFLVSNNQSVRNDLAKLNGARFVTASESGSGKRLDETVVKQMTGGDCISARFLYGEHFEFVPQFKLWLSTNHKPTIRGLDEGIWRRMRLIPFTVQIQPDQQDLYLKEKLKLEASGILNWALEGLTLWQAGGLRDPDVVKDATKEYRAEQDVIGNFISDRCGEDHDNEIEAHKLYVAYKNWAEASSEFTMNERNFSNAMAEKGFQKVRRSSGNVWKDIAVLPTEESSAF